MAKSAGKGSSGNPGGKAVNTARTGKGPAGLPGYGYPAGHSGDIVRHVMLAAVENRFGNELHTPSEIEWLSDNGSGYTADDTRRFAVAIGLKPLTPPVCSPQGNGMAESFVKTMKRDYVAFTPKPDAATAARNLAIAFEHYHEKHLHSALQYRSPRGFRRSMDSATVV
jgi:putative transposase